MKCAIKKILVLSILGIMTSSLTAQDQRTNLINTAMPSLSISPDAKSGGMGHTGVATLPDAFSQHWNAAKYSFASTKSQIGVSYSPWMKKLADDMALYHVAGFYKLGNDDNQAISASLSYFSIGNMDIINGGHVAGGVSPYEMSFDLAYSRKLTSTFSMGVALRYLHSNYSGFDDVSSQSGFAADISGYNESYIMIGSRETLLSFGFNISNIGPKMQVANDEYKSFLPTNLGLGASIMYPLDDLNTLSLSLDLNKLMVPTPPDPNKADYEKKYEEYQNRGVISGMFRSFGDAPDGFSEEMKEITWSVGAEYVYDNKFSLRTGYFHENKDKGNRKFITFGGGFKFRALKLDAAYLLSTVSNNPLDQTLRVGLTVDIFSVKDLFK